MPSIAPPRFEWHDLPSTPHDKNRSFAIYTPQIELQQDIVLPDLAVTWAESPKYVRDVERVKESLQGYKLRHHEKAGQGRLFYYGKVLTEEERVTPFLEWPVRRMHFWPTVLLKLWFEQTTAVPLSGPNADGSIATTPRLLDRAKYRDGDSYPTTFIIRQYLSDEPWPSSRFKTVIPLTDSVRWNFLSNQGSFPECLHPKCTFPSFQTTGSVLFGAGTESSEIGGDIVAQEFPATPMEDWEKYVVEVSTNHILGQWFYEEIIALPPIDDREVTT